MKHLILISFLLICGWSIYGKKDHGNLLFYGKKEISIRLSVKSDKFQSALYEIVTQRCEAKNIHIITDEEFKELSQRHFADAYRNAGGDSKTVPDPQKLQDALKTTDSFIDCLYLYFKVAESDSLIIDSLHYQYGKFPYASKKAEKIVFDVSSFKGGSPEPIIDSLLNIYIGLRSKKKR